tara:strand:+ start:120 stop:257 length:138 start_codon:yes stop_codon:yes gene_type:complete
MFQSLLDHIQLLLVLVVLVIHILVKPVMEVQVTQQHLLLLHLDQL